MLFPLLFAANLAIPPGEQLCTSLLAFRDQARAEGRLQFDAYLELEGDAATPRVDVGEPFTIGRITFRGHRVFADATLRRALTLNEGDLLDLNRLNESLGRLSAFGASDVSLLPDQRRRIVDVIIAIEEAKPGSWSISGPAGPPRLFGPFGASLAMRLPVLATWHVALTAPFLAVSLTRMYVPGGEWLSGITLSPMASVRSMATAWGLQQLRGRLTPVPLRPDPLAVRIHWPGAEPIVCEPRGPKLKWLRIAAGMAIDWGLPAVLY